MTEFAVVVTYSDMTGEAFKIEAACADDMLGILLKMCPDFLTYKYMQSPKLACSAWVYAGNYGEVFPDRRKSRRSTDA